MDYRLNEKRNTLAFGKYSEISLLQARAQRTEARKLIKAEIDPARDRDQKNALSADAAANTFEKVARHQNEDGHKDHKAAQGRSPSVMITRLGPTSGIVIWQRPVPCWKNWQKQSVYG